MSNNEDWITAAINKLPSASPLEVELKSDLEKLVRDHLQDDLLKPGQLTVVAQRFLKFCKAEKS